MIKLQATGGLLATPCDAIRSGRRLQFTYDGLPRVVEAHAAGVGSDGRPLMRAWQLRGGSRSSDPTGWRLFHVARIGDARLLEERSEAPRPGYVRGDPAIKRIICEV